MPTGWTTRELHWTIDAHALPRACQHAGECAWLDGSGDLVPDSRGGRFSLFCHRPLARLVQTRGGPAELTVGGVVIDREASTWRLLRRAIARMPQLPPAPTGWAPGWIGYFGFELAHQLERLPAPAADDLGLPLARLALYDRGIVVDHRQRCATAIAADGVRAALGVPDCEETLDAWAARLRNAAERESAPVGGSGVHVEAEWARESYERAVRRALEYIAAGDIYQVNLAQRLRISGLGDPIPLFAALRRENPAPYAALLCWNGGAIASVSPELFLQLRGDAVLTRPIKGTRPRTTDPIVDEEHRRALIASEKEAAELAMIVDLHRNDIGRVCRYGSVQVPHPRRLEAHPTVFHTVADVAGRLAPGRGALDLLEACFPAGSVSGVPKIRALEIIGELEPVARGAYTGAVGVLGLDGQMVLNVAIRTLQICGQQATLYVGGGIVADSDPAAEYEETLAKARGILRGLGVSAGEPAIADRR